MPVVVRPLALERQPGIEVESLSIRDRRWWRVKDPVAMRFWQLGDEEYFLWSQLTKEISLEELQRRFAERFAPRRIELTRLHEFLGMLHREGLIRSSSPGQGAILLARHEEQRKRRLWGWTNVLALRFPGMDPTPVLEWLYPRLRVLVHPLMLVFWTLLILSAVGLLVVQADALRLRLPQAQEFLTPQNLMILSVVLAGAKICHELGHALVCRHLGGRCHEFGFMLLVFTPCLYCNVSDAWLMPSRWRRMAISGAGMAVELVLAAVATWLWWFSEPGLFSAVCLNLMVVCSINTLLFNGNPLLRFDGYFLLSDFLDVPNLRQAGDEWLRHSFRRLLWGAGSIDPAPAIHDRPWIIPLYAIAAWCYRWTLTVVVWWVVYEWFRHQQMTAIGGAIVLSSAVVMMVQLGRAGCHEWKMTWRNHRAAHGRARLSVLVILGLMVALAAIPLPRTVRVPTIIRPEGSRPVYVTIPGTLVSTLPPGQRVQTGGEIARLENDEIEWDVLGLSGQRDYLSRMIDRLRRQQVQQSASGLSSAAGQIPILEKQLTAVSDQLERRKRDLEQLVLRAPSDGAILMVRRQASNSRDDLGTWLGTPFEPHNVGSFLESGTVVCLVGSPDRRQAEAIVDQTQIESIQVGQSVTVHVDELQTRSLSGTVRSIDSLSSESAPAELVAKQMLPQLPDRQTKRLPGTFYRITISLPRGKDVPFGASGKSIIHVAPRSVARRVYELLCATFR